MRRLDLRCYQNEQKQFENEKRKLRRSNALDISQRHLHGWQPGVEKNISCAGDDIGGVQSGNNLIVEFEPPAVVCTLTEGGVVSTLHGAVVVGNGVKLVSFWRNGSRFRPSYIRSHFQIIQWKTQIVLFLYVGTCVARIRIKSVSTNI